jgi:hypothetical protein
VRGGNTLLPSVTIGVYSHEQVIYTTRKSKGLLLGYVVLNTSALPLRHPTPGDAPAPPPPPPAPPTPPGRAAAADPVPGGLSPARSAGQREAVGDAASPHELIDPADEIDARRFPTVHRLAGGLAQDVWEQEFEIGLANMLDRIAAYLSEGADGADGSASSDGADGSASSDRADGSASSSA